MATVPNPMHHGRRLFEMLEEQQEPFLLDVYLLEHGYSDRAMKTNAVFMCWPGSACRRLRKFSTHGFKRKRAGFLRCLLNKVVYSKVIRKAWRWDGAANGSGKWRVFGSLFEMKGKNNVVEFHLLSYSGGTDEGELEKEERWRALGSSNQLSPVSVLELHSDEVDEEIPSTSSFNSPKETKEGPWIGFEEHLYSNSHDPQKANTKSQLFQPHYFVIDCMGEVGRFSSSHECLSPERNGKIVEKEMLSWENQSGALDNLSQLIDFDLSKSSKEWSHFQHETREVGIEIEHIIFEEIREETVLAVLHCHCTSER